MNSSDPFLQARAIFVLSELGDKGKAELRSQLSASEIRLRIAAFRALLAAGDSAISLATLAVNDPAPGVRREASIALRGLSLDDSRSLLIQLAAQVDGEDRFAMSLRPRV